ncbi:MAG: FecR domain-containing protein [Myxococcaceae bacterium]|nr:FecR domain-containing protein [Myxococcaceae bacterium]
MSDDASTPPTDPTWERFSDGLKASRAATTTAPTPNEVARLLQRLDEREAQAPGWSRFFVPAAVAALVVAIVGTVVALRSGPSDPPWTAVAVVASNATTAGSVTETAADGRALFQLGDDRVGVGPGSRLEVAAASARATRVVLSKGSVAAHVDPSRGARQFDVETPLGRVHVVGTIFRVEVGASLVVEVEKGTVEVSTGAGTNRVTVGERLEAKDGAVSLGARVGGSFSELSETTPVVKVEPPVEPEPVALVEPEVQPEPTPKKRPVAPTMPSKLAEWRTRAARGECGLVMPEVKRFLASAPQDVPARLTLADCQRRSGDVTGAVESYLAAADGKGAESNRGALLAGSLLQDELKQPKKALPLFDRYLARGAESKDLEASTLVRKARAYQALGQQADAAKTVELVLKKYPESPAAADALRLRDALH